MFGKIFEEFFKGVKIFGFKTKVFRTYFVKKTFVKNLRNVLYYTNDLCSVKMWIRVVLNKCIIHKQWGNIMLWLQSNYMLNLRGVIRDYKND